MKKTKIIIAGVVIILICLGALAAWKHWPKNQPSDGSDTQELVWNPDAVTGSTLYCSLKSTYMADGIVAGDEYGYLDYYMADGSTASCRVNIGDRITKGTVLFEGEGVEILSRSDGYVVNLGENNGELQATVLNENKLYITVSVPYEQFSFITYDSKVQVTEDHTEYTGYIHRLGYEYKNGEVEVVVGFDGYIMPGKTANVEIDLGESGEHLWILSDFVTSLGGMNYTYVIDDSTQGTTHMQELQLGNMYTVLENDNAWNYYMDLGGLSENTQVASAPLMVSEEDISDYYEGSGYGQYAE